MEKSVTGVGIGELGFLWEFVVQIKSHHMPTYHPVSGLSQGSHLQGEWFALRNQMPVHTGEPHALSASGDTSEKPLPPHLGFDMFLAFWYQYSPDPALWIPQVLKTRLCLKLAIA